MKDRRRVGILVRVSCHVGSLNCLSVGGPYPRVKASGPVNDLPEGCVRMKFSMTGDF